MTSLQRLSLEGNRLTALPKELGDLSALRVLNANGNLLTAIPGASDGWTVLCTAHCACDS